MFERNKEIIEGYSRLQGWSHRGRRTERRLPGRGGLLEESKKNKRSFDLKMRLQRWTQP